MKSTTLREIKLFVKIDDLSKKKYTDRDRKRKAWRVVFKKNSDDIYGFEEQRSEFKEFYEGVHG